MQHLTTTEAAEILGIQRKSVTAACVQGRIQGAVKRGRDFQIPAEEVTRYRDQRHKGRGRRRKDEETPV